MPDIIWHGSPLTLRHEGKNHVLTTTGGVYWNTWYQNLPPPLSENMPLYGNQEVNTADSITVVLPADAIVYMFRVESWSAVDMTGWIEQSTGSYLSCKEGCKENVKLYRKTLRAGEHILDNNSAMYLFVPGNYDRYDWLEQTNFSAMMNKKYVTRNAIFITGDTTTADPESAHIPIIK